MHNCFPEEAQTISIQNTGCGLRRGSQKGFGRASFFFQAAIVCIARDLLQAQPLQFIVIYNIVTHFYVIVIDL